MPNGSHEAASLKLLGAILAGGQSRRFGSDKARAPYQGRPLLDHVTDVLRPQVDALVVAGRDWPGLRRVDDLPRPGLGPLGGLAGAIEHAAQGGYDAVLCSGCDILGLPADLAGQLGAPPAIIADIPVVGLWPAGIGDALLDWLQASGRHSVYAFADHIGARRVSLRDRLRNINRPHDLEQGSGAGGLS